jgi:hypothetical protein
MRSTVSARVRSQGDGAAPLSHTGAHSPGARMVSISGTRPNKGIAPDKGPLQVNHECYADLE